MLRTNKETGVNLSDVFQPFKISNQELSDPHRFEQKCLGVACIHVGDKTIPQCTFYEIIESTEISETSSPEQEELLVYSDESSSLDGLASFALTKSLPPKKRKRRRMVRCDLVFTVDATFYSFPRETLVECLTTTVPHKLVLSFLPVDLKDMQCTCVLEEGHFKTKLEEFAAVCSHSCKLTDQSKSEKRIQNILISNVSFELLQAIKQASNVYEMMCQNMMELMRLHHEKVTHHRSEAAVQSNEWNHDERAKEEEYEDDDMEDVEEEKAKPQGKNHTPNSGSIKKCLYCGSKSTPMWRRGPQGAGTLCNACGVKWKHGKILNGADSAPQTTTRRGSKAEKKRKRPNTSTKKNSKRKSTTIDDDEFAVPAPPMQQPTWDTTSSSSMSESPLESSPNTSPLHKEGVIAYSAETLSIYAGQDAVEAAALLTLLKRS